MARIIECPKCGADISDTYEPDDPSVGIVGGWYCDACDLGVGDEDGPQPHDDDVQLFGSASSSGCCAGCGTPLESGYGMAGGGMGPYMYCPNMNCKKPHFTKSQEH